MHILVVNDDGPPSNQSSPYIHSLVHTLQTFGHTVSVILPHRQRSWIGKAHLVGATVKPTYFRPGTLHHDDGTIHHLPGNAGPEGGDEWVLIDSTPASCVQIGLYHYFQDRGPVDLVVSGPNYGRNTTALFSLSSGTIGGAMEAAVCGVKAIALSYAFSSRNHDPVVIAEASKHSTRVIEYLHKNWAADVDLYTVNVPLEPGISQNKILYTNMLDNRWSSGSCFEAIDAETSGEGPDLQEQHLRQEGELKADEGGRSRASTPGYQHKHFKWSPKFSDIYKSVHESSPGNDGWAVKEGMTSVTPLRANFMHASRPADEIKLTTEMPKFYALVDYEDAYVQPLIVRALQNRLSETPHKMISSLSQLPDPVSPVLQYRVYEQINFDHPMAHPRTSLVNSYIIRKALTRKHYLSTTIAQWITKYPDSILRHHFKPAVEFELDFAEFLDEALVEAYELRESFEKNEGKEEWEKEWWILKPGMSDRGQGIRLFNSESSLQAIFEEWEEDDEDESLSQKGQETEGGIKEANARDGENEEGNSAAQNGIVTSQLRHFVAQPYIHPPLLLPSSSNRKFHIRAYVVAVGSLKVYVCREMLALFAEETYADPCDKGGVEDLSRHLTNTCLQTGEGNAPNLDSVRRFWSLDETAPMVGSNWKEDVYQQICSISGAVFEAAARGMLVHFQTLPNAFEVFGVDFLVDGNGHAWLLELNAFPDFRQTGDELRDEVVGQLFEGIVEVAIKPFFNITTEVDSNGSRASDHKQFGLSLVADLELGKK